MINGGGGYAEYCIVEQESTFRIPGDLSFNEAACIPECFFTAWSNVIQRGRLSKSKNFNSWGNKWNWHSCHTNR